MSGAEAMRMIRERERARGGHLPILTLTAHALKGDRERCLDAGADGYVAKPIVPADLFAEIDSVMARAGGAPASTATGATFDPKGLSGGDADRVYRTVHTLRGSASNFGAERLTGLAQRLEAYAREGDVTHSASVFTDLEAETKHLIQDLAESRKTTAATQEGTM